MKTLLSILLLLSLANVDIKASSSRAAEHESADGPLSKLQSLSTTIDEIDKNEINQRHTESITGAIYDESLEEGKTSNASEITSQGSSIPKRDAFIEYLKSRPIVILPYEGAREYTYHQQVSERFFRRPSKNPIVREIIIRFRDEFSKGAYFTRINLSTLSSRTRILLLRELTTHLEGYEKTVPFSFHSCTFEISFQPNLRQPGNGIISNIGKINEIYTALSSYPPEKQREFAEKLLNTRKSKKPYHPPIADSLLSNVTHVDLNLQILNILLDFEVARRLQGDIRQEENSSFKKAIEEAEEELRAAQRGAASGEYDWGIEYLEAQALLCATRELERPLKDTIFSTRRRESRNMEGVDKTKQSSIKSHKKNLDDVPIASAIIGILKLSSRLDSPLPFSSFFHSNLESDYISTYEYKKGTWNVFEGLPSSCARKDAAARIIGEIAGGVNTHPFETYRISRMYYEIYGGESESEDEDAEEY